MEHVKTGVVVDDVEPDSTMPAVGREYEDSRGRVLRVHAVHVGEPDGREVLGTLREKLGENAYSAAREYATTVAIWEDVWLNKAAPWDPGFARAKGELD